MKSGWLVCAALIFATSISGCSVYMEATRPTPTDLNEFPVGMTREQVVAKLGAPDTTANGSDWETCDYYKLYTRGYGAGGKIPIAIAEGAADFFTIGLAEIVLTPTEGVTKNEKHPVEFCYHGQQLARIITDTGGAQEASSGQSPPLAAGQNPPITAASSDAGHVQPITNLPPSAPPSTAPASSPPPAPPPSTSPNLPE
jgi:outer membrane protein assembly factor BamE (lipoprotein component of BamABCDE complex)